MQGVPFDSTPSRSGIVVDEAETEEENFVEAAPSAHSLFLGVNHLI